MPDPNENEIDFGFKPGAGDEDDDGDIGDVSLSLTQPPPGADVGDEDEPKPQAAAEATSDEGAETDEDVLGRVANALGFQGRQPQEADGTIELKRQVDELRARWQEQHDILNRALRPQETGEPKQPGPLDLMQSPQMARIIREALESDDPEALNKVLFTFADRVSKVRAKEEVEGVRTELAELKTERDTAQDVAHRKLQMGTAIAVLRSRGGTATQLANDLLQQGTNSYLWRAWSRIPNSTSDGKVLAMLGIGLAHMFDEADAMQRGDTSAPGLPAAAGSRPAAQPVARAARTFDGGTGTRPGATRREPSQPTTQPTNEDLAENVAKALRGAHRRRGSSLLDAM
jgi:hypothetical protein